MEFLTGVFPYNIVKTRVGVIISARQVRECVYATTIREFMCFALSCCSLLSLSGSSVWGYLSTLMYCSGNSAHERVRLALLHPFSTLSFSSPLPTTVHCASFSNGYESSTPMVWRNSRNFTFESCASAALCGSSAASSEDNLHRIRPNSASQNCLSFHRETIYLEQSRKKYSFREATDLILI